MRTFSEFKKIKFKAPWWYLSCVFVLPLVIAAPVVFYFLLYSGAIGVDYSAKSFSLINGLSQVPTDKLVKLFAIAVSMFCFLIATLMLLICTPVYLYSENPDRSEKAGGLVKTSLGFMVSSGGAVLGTLSFT